MTETADASGLNQMTEQQKHREARKVVLSSYLGSTIEFYDFLLYASASALVFPAVFFSSMTPAAGAVAGYLTFAAGYVARPLGGMIFGHFGDRIGRKKMLVLSMMIMGIVSILIGLIPSAASIGMAGGFILLGLRFLQGIAIGGEWGGAALMALEHSDPKRRGFAASFVNAGAPTGAALGTFAMGFFASLPDEAFLSWGWRVPFLGSALLLIIGMIVRTQIAESPIFKEALAREEMAEVKPELPLLSIIRRPKNLLLVMFGGAAGFALQVLLSTFIVRYAVAHGAERQPVLFAFAAASLVSIFMVVAAGRISDRLGRRPVMLAGLALFIALIWPLFGFFGSASTGLIFLGFVIALLCHSLIYGPLAAFISEQFGTKARYTGASLGYQMATLLGAGFTPTILAGIYGDDGRLGGVMLYIAGLSALSAIAILLTKESKDIDLETYEH